MKTKMMNPIVVRVPPPVQAAIGEAATALPDACPREGRA
jgi:hypothetical protein